MKKIFLLLSIFAFISCKSNQDVVNSYKVDFNDVSETLNYLSSDELEGRDTGSEGIEKAATYLETILKQAGIKPYFTTYKDTLSNIANAYNVVGFIEGTDSKFKNEWVILGAHYDHIGITEKGFEGDFINNGANDNASGTTVLTEIAKYLGKIKQNKRSVLIVFFSAEEKGLLGAKHLANKLKDKGVKPYVLLNFEMLGVPMSYDFDMFLTGYYKSNMADKINEYAKSNLVGVSADAEKYDLFKASDNYPFYEIFNIPSHTVSAFDFTNFNYYHHPKDEASQMDVSFMTNVSQKLLPVIDKMINSESKEIKLKN